MIENPELGKPNLSAISENDRKLIDEFNKTDSIIPDYLIQNFFEEQSDRKPDKTAVISGMESLTYKELNTRANQLARHLLNLDLIQGDIVGICLERSVEMIISILGVLKAGACYLPIDPSFPDERIYYMFEDAGAKIMISQDSLKWKFSYITGTSFFSIASERFKLSNYSIFNYKDRASVFCLHSLYIRFNR